MNSVIRRMSAIDSASFELEVVSKSPVRSVLPPPTAEEQSPCRDLRGQVVKTEEHYFAYGGFSELYRGEWTDPLTGHTQRVAIKCLRGAHTDYNVLEVVTRRLHRETRVWHSLSHMNVLPFLGICHDLSPSPAMVSPLYENGTVIGYLKKNPQADRLAIVIGVARGLEYLHSQDVVHGDLKSGNVLISDNGIPLIADFGRSKFIDHRGFTTSFAGSGRYLAPELVMDAPDEPNTEDAYQVFEDQPRANTTRETDVFAFSIITLEILTGVLPYFYLRQDSSVIALVQDGARPDRKLYLPITFADPTWALLVDCWSQDPEERPNMGVVVQRLEVLR